MREGPVGSIQQQGDQYELTLEREYPLPPERVWSALVEPEQLAKWLADVTHDGRVARLQPRRQA